MSCFVGILSAQTYRIGDLYTAPDGSKGIVYYLFPDNSGGWVVALNDVSTGCAWGAAGDVPGLGNLNPAAAQGLQLDTAGYTNTQIIRAFQNNNATYAAGVVDFNSGWVLPSSAQLTVLFAQIPFITGAITSAGGTEMTTDGYWSSTEFSDSEAWRMRFGDGYLQVAGKASSLRVRAVRRFSYDGAQTQTVSYLWNTGATTSSITVAPGHTTTYTVTVSTSGGTSDTAQHTIVVNSLANEEITQTACESYEWNGHTYTESGDYPVVFHVPGGCDSTVTLHLTIYYPPEVSVVANSDTICLGADVTLQARIDTLPIPASVAPAVSIGHILCTDGSVVKPSDWPVSGKTAAGIVFYVDQTGAHGWAVSLQQQETAVRWSPFTSYSDIPTLTNYDNAQNACFDLDGYNNTLKIRDAGDATIYPVAYAMDFDNGWYLPAAGQLRLLCAEIVTLNASLQIVGGTQFPLNTTMDFWTSTEHEAAMAWVVSLGGSLAHYLKSFQCKVRGVRNF